MTEIIQRKLNDSAWVRWTALILIALTMFFGYMFVDMMSPLQSMIEAQRGWTPDVFGMYGSSEFIFNVFGFLILQVSSSTNGCALHGNALGIPDVYRRLHQILRRERRLHRHWRRGLAQ